MDKITTMLSELWSREWTLEHFPRNTGGLRIVRFKETVTQTFVEQLPHRC